MYKNIMPRKYSNVYKSKKRYTKKTRKPRKTRKTRKTKRSRRSRRTKRRSGAALPSDWSSYPDNLRIEQLSPELQACVAAAKEQLHKNTDGFVEISGHPSPEFNGNYRWEEEEEYARGAHGFRGASAAGWPALLKEGGGDSDWPRAPGHPDTWLVWSPEGALAGMNSCWHLGTDGHGDGGRFTAWILSKDGRLPEGTRHWTIPLKTTLQLPAGTSGGGDAGPEITVKIHEGDLGQDPAKFLSARLPPTAAGGGAAGKYR